MKKILFAICTISLLACNAKEPVVKNLPAKEFTDSIRVAKDIQIIDVRTAQEFAKGNIPKSINIDFNAPGFKETIQKLDKKKPVYIYCFSGERSAKSVDLFKEVGFENIYTMEGGVMALNAVNKGAAPGANAPATAATVTPEQYDEYIAKNKNVIVDFYADWCGPCKQMAPVIEKLQKDNSDKFTILKVNTDHSRDLAAKFKITSIPRLFIFKDGKQVDDVMGFNAADPEAFKARLMKSFK